MLRRLARHGMTPAGITARHQPQCARSHTLSAALMALMLLRGKGDDFEFSRRVNPREQGFDSGEDGIRKKVFAARLTLLDREILQDDNRSLAHLERKIRRRTTQGAPWTETTCELSRRIARVQRDGNPISSRGNKNDMPSVRKLPARRHRITISPRIAVVESSEG